ncbi:hypothetical protein OCF56_21705 [Bacillus mycoides]|uniref:hypothetical protein n=1 Tax=Bacillus mycoides TaxID=1405 RepID=UPI0021CDCED9|nr:hypothetical protein [Bacillus mycoides]MCU5656497.1 hypothetical protein [Bacillus mycoides]
MVKKLEGKGIFKFNDELEFNGEFSIGLNSQGILNCMKDKFVGFFGKPPFNLTEKLSPWSFEGKTSDGETISLNNMSIVKIHDNFNDNIIKHEFNFNQLTIGNQSAYEYFEFFIPNFITGFDHFVTVNGLNIRNRTNFSVLYNEEEILLDFFGINNLVNNWATIQENNEDINTVKIVMRKQSGMITFSEAAEIIELLLELCSIAYGSRLTWSKSTGFQNNSKAFQCIQNVPYAPLNGRRQLINVLLFRRLSQFIQQCFPNYITFDDETRTSLKKLVSGIHLASSRLVFPAPYAILGSIIEEFAHNELEEMSTHYVIRSERRENFQKFKQFIEENVIELLSDDDKEDFNTSGMKQKWSGLLQRNLRSRITSLLLSFHIEFDTDKIRDFVKKRNEAAHGTYVFEKERDYYIWSQMTNLLEQVLLKKLKYQGEYIDYSTNPAELKVISLND